MHIPLKIPVGPYLCTCMTTCLYWCRSSRSVRVISVSSPITASVSPPPSTCTPSKSNNTNTPSATHLNTSPQSVAFHSSTGTHTILF